MTTATTNAKLAPTDPELDYLRRLYLDELRAALAEAFGRLTVRERNLLRHAFVQGLTVDAIGALYRSTAPHPRGGSSLRTPCSLHGRRRPFAPGST